MTEAFQYSDYLPEIPSTFNVQEVIVAGDRGPCGGVIRAIDATFEILDHIQRIKAALGIDVPVFASHQIVHHEPISAEFSLRGLVIEPDWENIKLGAIYLLSAHGTK